MRFEVLILGNSSATPMYERHPSSQVLNFNEQLFLIDCGEGTQMQLFRYGIKSNKISHIFISHLHGDHYLGLVGLLSSMNLSGRKNELHLYAPLALKEILYMQFKHSDTVLRYDLIFHSTNAEEPGIILQTKMLTVTTFPLKHRIPTTGFRFDEGKRSASLIRERIEKLKIPTVVLSQLKRGIDYTDTNGKLYKASELTLPAPRSRSYAYCSDTRAFESYVSVIRDVDLLYHETTFLHEMVERAKETFHSTSLEAAEVALQVGASKLLMGHYSARYRDLTPLLTEAKSKFSDAQLSEEGKWYLV
ncbi:ribonuclease Z [Sphingobacterium alkalisoli]|uniref:Ribonuclease Z n=1 Tax=Sphingobacterium alkalisoli TaxID=1874115 RepID=A0A4U0H052_9SPHI|nr:ribonuclease Z [Sphingobacterium alkalisoli]TJY64384.1 ribonuclease Z [Sphingobacterium alkalisoli]GGH22075.1 ribonuclease Z [Sphingobacterium alkalisoli]